MTFLTSREGMFQTHEKISLNQVLMLTMAGAIGNIFVVMSVPAVQAADHDGWLCVLLAYGTAAMVGIMAVRLAFCFPDETIIQYLPRILGTVLGKVIGLIYVVVFWLFSAVVTAESKDLLTTFLPETPTLVLMVMLMLPIVYVMRKGFEVFARTLEVLIPLAWFMLTGLVVFSLPDISPERLSPILEQGIVPVLRGVPRQLAFSLETVLFMCLWLPCLNWKRKNQVSRRMFIGLLAVGMLLSTVVAAQIALFGSQLVVNMTFPVLLLARHVAIGEFFERLDAAFLALWVTSSYIQIAVFLYPAAVGMAQWLNLRDYRPLVLPMAATSVALAMIPTTVPAAVRFNALLDLYVILPLALSLPVLWLVAVIRMQVRAGGQA